MEETEHKLRFRGGVGFDRSTGKWCVVIQLWIEPDMNEDHPLQYAYPGTFETADEAETFYRVELRDALLKPLIKNAQKDGMTIEHLVASVSEIGEAVIAHGDN